MPTPNTLKTNKRSVLKTHNYLGFTLVELIVVITILVILGTIAFVSLGGFSGSARDSSRVSDLSLIGKGLDIHYTKLWSFPSPTSATGITYGGTSSIVWYQWTIWEGVIRSLGGAWARISTKPTDPLSKSEYRYSLPTGVNEYLLGADYEGDSVAWRENWELRAENWESGTPTSFWIPHLTSPKLGEELSFSSPILGGVGGGILGLNPEDSASASTGSPTISYLKGTYNGVATRVSSGSTINIIALPSIFLSSGSTGTIVDASSRNFLLQGKSLSWVSFVPKVVYSSGALPSNDTERLLFSSGIVAAYSGTSLATNSDIKSFIDNVNSTGSLSAIGGNFVRNKFGGNGPSIVATASSASSSSYSVGNSLMFNGSNQFLSRTLGTTTSLQKGTYSAWVKRSQLGAASSTTNAIFDTTPSTGRYGTIHFYTTNDYLVVEWTNQAGALFVARSQASFRDPSAWYHVVVSFDTTQPAPADRVKVWVNGVLQTMVQYNASWITFPNQNDNLDIFASWATAWIGRYSQNTVCYLNGYLSNIDYANGLSLTATWFGQFDSTTGQWSPQQYTGDYGANGFHLDFSSGATAQSLGADSAPISGGHTVKNDWTVYNMSVVGNQMIDSPTNNFATLNRLDVYDQSSNAVWTNGNMKVIAGGNLNFRGTIGLAQPTYWETTLSSATNPPYPYLGIADQSANIYLPGNFPNLVSGVNVVGIRSDGYIGKSGGSVPGGATFGTGDILMQAFDPSSWKWWFGKNGTWFNGDHSPSTGTGYLVLMSTWIVYTPWMGGNNFDVMVNFGQGGQDFSTGNRWPSAPYADDGWIGKFRYQPPAGFKALSTANLPDPAIKNPKQYFDILTYTGNGSTQTITGLTFRPDLVWMKDRVRNTQEHHLADSVRGVQKKLSSNQLSRELTSSSYLQAFNPDGITVGADGTINYSGDSMMAWNWKRWSWVWQGGPGFDVVTFSGSTGNPITIGHSLWAIPKFVTFKNTSSDSTHWGTNYLPLGTGYLWLESNAQWVSAASGISGTAADITIGWGATTTWDSYVAYLWSEVPWFSKFGSYTGNGSATGDGPFVYTGFKPRWIMIKRADVASISTSGAWMIVDTLRYPANGVSTGMPILMASSPNAEVNFSFGAGGGAIDVLSNGFKPRGDYQDQNASWGTYIYAAFAETPFKYATAR